MSLFHAVAFEQLAALPSFAVLNRFDVPVHIHCIFAEPMLGCGRASSRGCYARDGRGMFSLTLRSIGTANLSGPIYYASASLLVTFGMRLILI